ncbi:thiamine phosphate synthase [Psychrosphaera sp. G1-22]|uniref:Thiamine-phosphate synthase n=1 Tax=Psychrosphaera algicola TaxID=3023714 RepID=A0ABT5FE78_9GAMM|nr:thiamine phosphate synthase [Psychrosphaera sp. G1-22]MDC2888891.1 thiamine phosphate synthase [Psychrosphaera sp. G1-22]
MSVLSNSIVWTIAGSDCTGGAGIQADCKTIHNLGAEACSIITAVTAQNSAGVIEINAVSIDVMKSQFDALEQEKPALVIKIGLLANAEQVELVAEKIAHYKTTWDFAPIVVYDPVAVASNGGNLTEDDILPTIKQHLLPVVDVLTPNNKELQQLTGVYVFSWDCMENAAQQALNLGPSSVLIKGGHIDIDESYCVDYCHDGYQHYWLASPKIATEHTHGSGCTFASALASLMAQGYLLRDAFTIAKAYINQGLRLAKDYEGPYGPIWQGPWPRERQDYPRVLVSNSDLALQLDWEPALSAHPVDTFTSGFAQIDEQKLGLYPVVDNLAWIERLLKAGIKTIQYREKILTGRDLEQSVIQAIELGRQYQARLFINDYWELAIKHKAYGVHLGQEDIQMADLHAIKQSGIKLGVSTHGHYEMLKIQEYQPSYLAVGAIFPTRTKDMTGQIQGVDTLAKLVELNLDIPMVAIGGITLERATEVIKTGVGSIAVVTAITEADDPEQAVVAFNKLLAKG